MSLAIPAAFMLSQCIGVGGCVCYISFSFNLIILPSLQLMNSAPSSASAANATTNFNTPHITNSDPFNFIVRFGTDLLPKKNNSATQLRARVSER